MMSWIHEEDLAGIFIHLLETDEARGVYNAVSPNPVNNREMVRTIGKVLHRPVFLPPVPGIVLKLILGEMAIMVLYGSRVSAEKILLTGYRFRFSGLKEALEDIFKSGR